jgi:hypothetical protein
MIELFLVLERSYNYSREEITYELKGKVSLRSKALKTCGSFEPVSKRTL